MTEASHPADGVPAERLFAYLREANSLHRAWAVGAAGLRGAGVLLAAVLIAVVLDASFAFGPTGLVIVDLLLLSLLAGMAMRLPIVAWRRRFRARRVAVDLERALGLESSELISAVDLAGDAPPSASAALRVQAVRRADELADTLPAGAAVDRGELGRAVRLLGLTVAVLAVAYVSFPRVFHAVVPRLMEPHADHPPYTPLRFAVTIEPEPVIQGRGATIRVTLDGPTLPEQATLVWAERERPPQRAPLLRSAATGGEADDRRHFVLRLDRVEVSRDFYVDTAEGRSRRHTLAVVPVPLFEEVRIRYDYPAYTGWPSTREPLRGSGLKALRGTMATLEVRSNVPLDGGTLTFTAGGGEAAATTIQPLVTRATDPHRGEFPVRLDHSGEVEATLTSGGLSTPEPLRAAVTAAPDGKPRVAITEPPQTVIAPEGWRIDVRIDAADDAGLSRLVLHRAVNGLAPSAVELPGSGDDPRRRRAEIPFDLAALGARAGDAITYFATAYDNMPEPQVAQTGVFVIRIVSQAEYEAFARTQYGIDDLAAEWVAFQQRLDDLHARRAGVLRGLDALRERLAAGELVDGEELAQVERLEAELDAYRQEALGLADDLRERVEQATLYEFERAYKDQLRRTEQGLRMQAGEADATRRALGEMRQEPSAGAATRVDQQAQRFREWGEPFDSGMAAEREQLAADLEAVRMADAMSAAAERLRLVIQRQRDLAERMQALRTDDPLQPGEQALANRLAEEQAALRDELAEARRRLEEASAEAGERLPRMSASAQRLAGRLDELGVEADQASAASSAYAGRGGNAAREARAAGEKLQSLLSDSQALGDGSDELDGYLSLPREAWQDAMRQLAQGRGVPHQGRSGQGMGVGGVAGRVAVMGPAPTGGEGDGAGRRGALRRPGEGRGGPAADDVAAEDAERIDAEAAAGRSAGVSVLTGVPLQYREAAEAYFRRLAEDERYDQAGGPLPPGDAP